MIHPMAQSRFLTFTVLAGLLVLSGCSSGGGKSTTQPPPPPGTTITALVPARTVVGDTVIVEGSALGATQGTSQVLFSGAGGTLAATVTAGGWSDTSIRVLVPGGAASGPVVVQKDRTNSNSSTFDVATQVVTYSNDLGTIFEVHGCASCHGGQNNLFLIPRSALLRGDSFHGPVVIRRRSGESVLVQKVNPNPPFGARMPYLSAPLSEVEIQTISDWIDQGTRDN